MHFQPYLRDDPPRPASAMPTPIVFERAEPVLWEYRVITLDPREEEPLGEERLNALGEEGWLLATTVSLPGSSGTVRIYYYFVRAR
jgi:hypothetical protein